MVLSLKGSLYINTDKHENGNKIFRPDSPITALSEIKQMRLVSSMYIPRENTLMISSLLLWDFSITFASSLFCSKNCDCWLELTCELFDVCSLEIAVKFDLCSRVCSRAVEVNSDLKRKVSTGNMLQGDEILETALNLELSKMNNKHLLELLANIIWNAFTVEGRISWKVLDGWINITTVLDGRINITTSFPFIPSKLRITGLLDYFQNGLFYLIIKYDTLTTLDSSCWQEVVIFSPEKFESSFDEKQLLYTSGRNSHRETCLPLIY